MSTKLLTALGNLPKQNDKVFGRMSRETAITNLIKQRKVLALKIGNPRIAKIHYHLIRHWKGTMEYHKRPDPDYVRRLLGHKSLLSTEVYISMEQAYFSSSSQEFTVKVAADLEEACKLLEVGFDYVTDIDSKKVFRKRK